MEIRLDQLKAGQMAIITEFSCEPALRQQLEERGVGEGTRLTCRYRSPDGKMTALEVHGVTLAVRTADLEQISVQLLRGISRTGQGDWRSTLERLLVSRRRGIPMMLAIFLVILWLTVFGANVPSELLQSLFDRGYALLTAHAPAGWWSDLLLDGVYATATRVLAVMLPPMAIFFPLFALLEEVGLLPRMAFLLDGKMRLCGGCGQQALTMCMGLGCNAVGVMGCRMIRGPRLRYSAILTNAMIPCNGRLATLIVLAGMLCGDGWTALAVAGAVMLGVGGAMACTALLHRKEENIPFMMELPPLRRPHIGKLLVRSFVDKTLPVAGQAMLVAVPAGAIVWLLRQGGVLGAIGDFLEPVGLILGLNGAILLAFFLSFPANELLIPMLTMLWGGTVSLSWPMALCAMVLTVFHWPCSTTLLTIYRETKSIKKTAAAFFLPTAVGFLLCSALNFLLGLLLT